MNEFMGEFFALTTALLWAAAVICFNQASGKTDAVGIKVFHNHLCTALLFLIVLFHPQVSLIPDFSPTDWLIIFVSALTGITIGDTLYLMTLQRLGPSLTAIVETSYAFYLVVFAFTLYGETLHQMQVFGIVLILSAVILISIPSKGKLVKDNGILVGVGLGLLCTFMMAFTVIIMKLVLEHHSVVTITFYRFLIGHILLMAIICIRKKQVPWSLGFHIPNKKLQAMGVVLGPVLATLAWSAGFKFAQAGVAAILNQTATIFICLLSWLIVKEVMTPRKTVSIIIAFLGVVLITIN